MTLTICIATFLTLYLANFLLGVWLSSLNIKHLLKHKESPPAPFDRHVEKERYQQTILYTTTYSRFGLVNSAFSAALFLLFVYMGWMNSLDVQVRAWVDHAVLRGALFFIFLYLLTTLLGIPFSLYSTFVIEERFGFNRQTPRLWVIDQLKGMALSLLLLIPLASVILYFMEYTGSYWWIFAWGAFFAYSFILYMVYPVLIAPIFNKFKPLEEGELRTTLEQMAQKASFPMQNIYVMDASRRSTHANAYFGGFGKTKRLVLYDCLVKDFTPAQIASVVAHEIGHFKKKHIWKHLISSVSFVLLFFYLLSLALDNPYLYKTFMIEAPSKYMGILLMGIGMSLISSFLSPLLNIMDWKFEGDADRYCLELMEDKEAIQTMLIKLYEKNLSNLNPHPLYARFYYSHPPVLKRLQNLGLAS